MKFSNQKRLAIIDAIQVLEHHVTASLIRAPVIIGRGDKFFPGLESSSRGYPFRSIPAPGRERDRPFTRPLFFRGTSWLLRRPSPKSFCLDRAGERNLFAERSRASNFFVPQAALDKFRATGGHLFFDVFSGADTGVVSGAVQPHCASDREFSIGCAQPLCEFHKIFGLNIESHQIEYRLFFRGVQKVVAFPLGES